MNFAEQMKQQIENIEKWSGQAYCGPNVNGAGPKGDEIYQAIYEMRKILGLDVSDYENEIKEATESAREFTCYQVKVKIDLEPEYRDVYVMASSPDDIAPLIENNYSMAEFDLQSRLDETVNVVKIDTMANQSRMSTFNVLCTSEDHGTYAIFDSDIKVSIGYDSEEEAIDAMKEMFVKKCGFKGTLQ